jgi:DNA-binding response OmpR family regulator
MVTHLRARAGTTSVTSRLLLVDDDPALLDALSGTLEARFGHFSLDTCNAGATALDLAKRQKYDTIIVDVNMPGMTGFEVLRAVRQLQPETPVLLISAHGDETMMVKAFEAGATAFIPKPFDRADLVNAVRRGLELSSLERHGGGNEKAGAVREELRDRCVRNLKSHH